jgi:hypothetical protein
MKIEMKKRIEQELQNTVPQKITKLEFDGDCRAQQLEGLTDEFENLKYLTLTSVGLTTLKGFPKLNNLKRLTLQDNCLNGGLENLAQCINLTHLDLKGNKIQCIEQLEPLACLKSLRVLELDNCEIAKTERYRDKIFALLPSVKFIDGLDVNGEEDEGEEFENEEADGDEENDGSFDGEEDDDDDEDDDEDGSEDDDASEDANEVGLSYLQKTDLGEDEDDEDFDAEKALQQNNTTAEEDDDEIDEEEVKAISEGVEIVNEDSNSRSCRKRKHEEDSNQ